MTIVGGQGDVPAAKRDYDYFYGVGTGGEPAADVAGSLDGNGGNGAAIFAARVPGELLPRKTILFYSGPFAALEVDR